MHILDTLKERGFIAQTVYEDDLYKLMEKEPVTFYLGIDPTADSMHIGHFIPVMMMSWLQKAGHKPIALCGGGTAMIGDPSGKSDLRKMLSHEQIQHNISCIKKQLEKFIDFSDNKALIVNNGDWLLNLNYIDFLRDIGTNFSVNKMLTAECYKRRMEKGLTFLEFNYMIMQSYDFLRLFKDYGCKLEIGGDDQWSNILAGADLIRRKEQQDAFAITCNLVMTHDGEKMGKTVKGALWLDPEKTTPYEFYQYWRNVADQDVEKFLALLTFLPMDEVRRLGALEGAEINEAKKILAYEITKMIHGQEEAEKAATASAALFESGNNMEHIPSFEISSDELAEDNRVVAILALSKLAKSKGEARKLISSGAVYVDDEKINDAEARIEAEALKGEGIIIRKGKKNFLRVTLS
ncbi:MAG: tyrosine--tRNA ligase [Eubacteriales bacterium]|nr:tyrosine--tRNA ligase [Eubacteriales bacterium]